ncbi:hypothetical protein F383_12720 [Gossypium arboreum]|uniref:Uncharacterized protein n=1 Tax=Gossypium arboreum TaxID=29729 RepID=A0A0B0NAU8_GOSAR|nr:hypothetical protein F383_12720 [Gossypium arboreum]
MARQYALMASIWGVVPTPPKLPETVAARGERARVENLS